MFYNHSSAYTFIRHDPPPLLISPTATAMVASSTDPYLGYSCFSSLRPSAIPPRLMVESSSNRKEELYRRIERSASAIQGRGGGGIRNESDGRQGGLSAAKTAPTLDKEVGDGRKQLQARRHPESTPEHGRDDEAVVVTNLLQPLFPSSILSTSLPIHPAPQQPRQGSRTSLSLAMTDDLYTTMGTATTHDTTTATAIAHHQRLAPLAPHPSTSSSGGSNHGSNRNSISSFNTFGQDEAASPLSASASISHPPSYRRSEFSLQESQGAKTDRPSEEVYKSAQGPVLVSRPQRESSTSSPTTSSKASLSTGVLSSAAFSTRSIHAPFGRGSSGAEAAIAQHRDRNGPSESLCEDGAGLKKDSRTEVSTTTSSPSSCPSSKNPNTLLSSQATLLHDSMAIGDDMHALKYQIRQATMVLTHVVQAMSVPSPAALLRVLQQQQPRPTQGRGQHNMQPLPRQETSQKRENWYSRPQSQQSQNAKDCNCALLQARIEADYNDSNRAHSSRDVAFLAACYCPDPWEFQTRVLRQIESMQQELHALRQEMLEVERRATMLMRQEVLEWEMARDKEWIELNTRLQSTFLITDEKEGADRGNNVAEPNLQQHDHGHDKVHDPCPEGSKTEDGEEAARQRGMGVQMQDREYSMGYCEGYALVDVTKSSIGISGVIGEGKGHNLGAEGAQNDGYGRELYIPEEKILKGDEQSSFEGWHRGSSIAKTVSWATDHYAAFIEADGAKEE